MTPPTDAPSAAPADPTAAPTVPAATPTAPSTPDANPAPTPAAADTASDAEATAVQAELKSEGASEPGGEFKLNFYGFADFTYVVPLRQAFNPYVPSFAVGKVNFYAASELGEDSRSLIEIRFMYLPNGSTATNTSASMDRIDTGVRDYTDVERPVRWGGISIERAWLEHTFHPLLTIRGGQWLTPYGIWNVDHGSPVIIGVQRPYIVGEALFPQSQTGIETYGSMGFGPAELGYHVTISNGRGPVDTIRDLDHNKAIGGRLFCRYEGDFGVLTVGASGYRGRYTDAVEKFSIGPNGLALTHPVTVRYDELSLAGDVKWEWGGFLAQTEAIMNDVAYDDRLRPVYTSLSGGPSGLTPDHRKYGIYGLAGYRTPLFGIMPWVGAEHYQPGIHAVFESVSAAWFGVNARPTPRIVLKSQFTHVWSSVNSDLVGLDRLDFQTAWSF